MAINNPIGKGGSIQIQIESDIGSSTKPLSNYKNLFFKQTRKGWLQNCLGCENKVEMRISTIENRENNIMYAIEESDCIYRICCPGHHPFKMILQNDGPAGPVIATYERELKCLAHPCKCCCYQELKAYDAEGHSIGRFTEDFYFCHHLPQYTIFDENEKPTYIIHPPVCMGCCVNICAEGLCNCRYPYYIYPFGTTGDHDDNNIRGKIVKVWAGLLNTFLDVHK